ncbi:hypothetical protein Tco_0109693 [Tanacetum coccineum]
MPEDNQKIKERSRSLTVDQLDTAYFISRIRRIRIKSLLEVTAVKVLVTAAKRKLVLLVILMKNMLSISAAGTEVTTVGVEKDMNLESAHMVAASKVPMLKLENENSAPKTIVVKGVEKVIPPTTVEEKAQKR